MKEQDLKKTLSQIHAKSDMSKEIIDNCNMVAEGGNTPKKKGHMWGISKGAVIAASLAVVVLTTTVYGEAIYKTIQQKIVIGNSNLRITSEQKTDGELIVDIDNIDVSVVTEDGTKKDVNIQVEEYATLEDAQANIPFTIELSKFLEQGYIIDKIDVFDMGDGDGKSAGVYLSKEGEEDVYVHAVPEGALNHVMSSNVEKVEISIPEQAEIAEAEIRIDDSPLTYSLNYEHDGVDYKVMPMSGEEQNGLQEIVDSYK